MKKNIVLYLFLFLFTRVYCQEINRKATMEYYGLYIEPRIKEFHSVNYANELKSLETDIRTTVFFNIDTAGKIINFKIGDTTFQPFVNKYLQRLIFCTNGQWMPKIENCRKVISDEYSYFIILNNYKVSMSQRTKKYNEKNADFLDFDKRASKRIYEPLVLPKVISYIILYF